MKTINEVKLSGTIVREVKANSFDSGSRVANATLGVDRGSSRDWIDIKGWDEIADALKVHGPNNLVFVDGSIRTDTYPDKNDPNKKHKSTYVLVERLKVVNANDGTTLCDVVALKKEEREQQNAEPVSA